MMTSSTFYIIIFLARVVKCDLTCLACQDSPRPRDCEFVTRCGPHESCYLDSYVTKTGAIVNQLGCRDSKMCSPFVGRRSTNNTILRRSSGNLLMCSDCCHGDLCNSKLCGQPGYPAAGNGQRGPLCFNCDQQLTPDSCNIIKECGSNEVCSLVRSRSQIVSSDILYSTGCTPKQVCDSELKLLNQASSVFGKRRYSDQVTSASGQICLGMCCDSDLCNTGCTDTQIVYTATTRHSTSKLITPTPPPAVSKYTVPSTSMTSVPSTVTTLRSTTTSVSSTTSSVAPTTSTLRSTTRASTTTLPPTSSTTKLTSAASTSQVCSDPSYTWMSGTGVCLKVSSYNATYTSAKTTCKFDGGDLVVIKTQAAVDTLSQILKQQATYWIGLVRNPLSSNNFRWADSAMLSNSNGGQFWGDGKPSSFPSDRQCVYVEQLSNNNVRMADHYCTTKKYFICEMNQ